MAARFAKTYIVQIFADREFGEIWNVIRVLERERKLPEEIWLFCRMYEWAPYRGGVWQYYEGLPDKQFNRVCQALDQFKLDWISEKYRFGKSVWETPGQVAELDAWLARHAEQIHAAIFELISPDRDCLLGGG